MSDAERKTMPVQVRRYSDRKASVVPVAVAMRAYDVYCHIFGPQDALVTGTCRGGFDVGELVGFLYAASFPREEWRKRWAEATKDMHL